MELILKRVKKGQSYTIGELYHNDLLLCNTLEDVDRGLSDDMDIVYIKRNKKYGTTAIPTGRYEVEMDIHSPRFSCHKFYREVCNSNLPRLKNVKGFDGILIHCGNTAKDTNGCILVGNKTDSGFIKNSRDTFKKVYNYINDFYKKGERIYITIL